MENTRNEMVVADVAKVDLVEELKNPNGKFYCSIVDDGTRKAKVAIYNAINSPDAAISENVGEILEVVNVVAHPVSLPNEETGEIIDCLRTVLITKSGKTYGAVSQGIASALTRIFSIVGMPDGGAWEKEPVKMKIKQVKTRNGNNMLTTIELV